MRSIIKFCIGVLICWQSSIFAQLDCTTNWLDTVYTDVEVTTVKYGEAINVLGNTQELMLDVYLATNNQLALRPLLILIHGGGFISGDKNSAELSFLARKFAKRGYVVASVNYRLGDFSSTLFDEFFFEAWMTGLHDVKAAYRFFLKDQETDNEYKISPQEVFVGGTSSGGILALHLAYLNNINQLTNAQKNWLQNIGGELDGASGNPGYCLQPKGVFAISGAMQDTAWIQSNDVPVYAIHAQGDGVMPFVSGGPYNPQLMPFYGGASMYQRTKNIGVINGFFSYPDNSHPAIVTGNTDTNTIRFKDTDSSLAVFFNEVLSCQQQSYFDTWTDCNLIFTTSINHVSTIYLLPNPTQGLVEIQSAFPIEYLRLHTSTGKMVYQSTSQQNQLDLSNLPSGIYLLHVQTKQAFQSFKVIKD